MRFLLAALLFILAVSLLLLGLAQRTIWAAPDSFSVNLAVSGDQPYVVIPAEELALMPGESKVSVSGDEEVFLAVGLENDVRSWVGLASHFQTVTSDDGIALGIREVVGTTDFASPVGSDLWVSESEGETFAEIQVPTDGKYAVLVANDGFKPAPGQIRISWPIVNSNVVSDIFLAVGSGLLLVAILLNLLALRRMLVNRGPRRKLPRAPQGPKYRPKKAQLVIPKKGRRSARSKVASIPVGLVLIASLTGCSMAPALPVLPTPSDSPTESVVEEIPPVVGMSQVRKILRELQQVVFEADQSGDVNLLESRVAGPALLFRQAHYLLMTKSPEIEPLPPISGSAISITLPASSNAWPRSFMIVTAGEGDGQLPQMLVMQQSSPREQYKLFYNIPLLPGSEIPAVPAAEVGSIPIEKDSLFLRLSPSQLPDAFGDVIDNGEASKFFNLFDLEGDEYYQQISTSQKEQQDKLRRAEITFSHGLGDSNVISLSTSDSGALVAVMMTDSYLIRPTRDNAAVTVSGNELLLLGVEGSAKGVRTQYGGMLLFYVPASTNNGKIVLLGATQSLLSIRAL
ncbi:unannotated protein [freshwater metagenome]|uniref:Unannotated protein n=1 Tax=freshwater metagenome TaxID=449393 RepID=A0A6J6J4E4_9ZZZZ|nr:hypothetical protein [Actinomycetota bacterium]